MLGDGDDGVHMDRRLDADTRQYTIKHSINLKLFGFPQLMLSTFLTLYTHTHNIYSDCSGA